MRNVLTIMMCAWAPVLWIGVPHAQGSVQTAAPAAALSGVVLNLRDGSAIEGAAVKYVGEEESAKGETKTDSNGEFLFKGLAPGVYMLTIEKIGYGSRRGIVRQAVQNETAFTEINMHDTGIKGSIEDVTQGGAAVEGATIMYVGLGKGNSGEVVSDQNGDFEIFPLAPDEYSLSVAADGYRDREDMIHTVIDGQMSLFEIKMRKKTTFFKLFGDRYGWNGALILLSIVAVIGLIFTLTASWLMRKAERQS